MNKYFFNHYKCNCHNSDLDDYYKHMDIRCDDCYIVEQKLYKIINIIYNNKIYTKGDSYIGDKIKISSILNKFKHNYLNNQYIDINCKKIYILEFSCYNSVKKLLNFCKSIKFLDNFISDNTKWEIDIRDINNKNSWIYNLYLTKSMIKHIEELYKEHLIKKVIKK